MLYLKAQELSQIQDVFNANLLQDENEISQIYQDTTEARTGDSYSGFVEKIDLLLEDSHYSLIYKLFIGHAGVGKTTELYRLKHIAEEKGFLTCMGRCDIDLDSGDMEYTDVLFYILDLLVNKACAEGFQISENIAKKIENYCELIHQIKAVIEEVRKQLQEKGRPEIPFLILKGCNNCGCAKCLDSCRDLDLSRAWRKKCFLV